MKKVNVNRMKLVDVMSYFVKQNLNQTALFFASCVYDSVTVDGWIEADFIRRHVGEEWMRKLECEVTTAIYI